MKTLMAMLCGLMLAVPSAYAQEKKAGKEQSQAQKDKRAAQREKMKACEAKVGDRKGKERGDFLQKCLKS